ncbi:hypothetical protein BKA93DRAFT_215921 [Sparassis latifolia]
MWRTWPALFPKASLRLISAGFVFQNVCLVKVLSVGSCPILPFSLKSIRTTNSTILHSFGLSLSRRCALMLRNRL